MKRFLSFLLAFALVLTGLVSVDGTVANAAMGVLSITESAGYEEGAYAQWAPVEGAEQYVAYVSADGATYSVLDDELIRQYADYWRVDAVGLCAGTYYIAVDAMADGEIIASGVTGALNVINYDRSGFAFSSESPLKSASGAYNDNGTLKSDAQVIYVTADTVNTVKAKVDGAAKTGLRNILSAKRAGTDKTPLDIRIIGCIDSEALGTGWLTIEGKSDYTELNITMEGIGEDATLHSITTTVKRAGNVEIRNLGILNFTDDGISVDTNNCNIWIHDLDITYGQTGSDGDQKKGDGSIDIKKSQYCTVAYNHFFDSGKCSLLDAGALTEGYVNNISMHHNWFDHSDSRHPRIRNGNAFHIYNNYYDGVAKYGTGITTGASALVEANYYRNCKYPMFSSRQGSELLDGSTLSGENGGIIKAYGNYMEGQAGFIPYSESVGSDFDAYVATTRDEQVPATVVTKQGGTSYSNFDTVQDIGVEAADVDAAADVPSKVMAWAGRVNGGDFKWEFDDATQDSNSAVIDELKTAVTNYKTSLVSVGGSVSSGAEEPGETTVLELNPSLLECKTYDASFEQNGFTVLATATETVAIDASSKTVNGVSYANRLKLSGTGSAEARSVKFTITGANTFSMFAMASNSSSTRSVGVATLDESTGTFTDVQTFTVPGSSLQEYSVELTAGTYYVYSKDGGLNIQYATLTPSSGSGSGGTTTPETVAFELNPSLLECKTYDANFEQNGFTVLATATSTVTIDASSKKIDDVVYENRLKLSGTGSAEARSIKFTTTEAAKLSVYAMASSSSATREVGVATYDEAIAAFSDVTVWTVPGSSLAEYTVELPTPGTYYVYSKSSGLNVQYATVTYGGVSSTPTTGAKYGIIVQNDGNGTAAALPATATAGTTITLSATPNAGYEFDKWEVVSGNVTISDDNTFVMPEGAVTVKAVFKSDGSVQADPVEAFVSRMYTVVLDRDAEEAGLNNWVAALKAGTHDGAGIAKEFVLGEEFKMKNLDNSAFLDVLYKTFFDREADADGKAFWMSVLEAGNSREFVLSNFVNLDEFTLVCASYGIERGVMLESGVAVKPGISQFVKRMYTVVLGRDAESAGLYNNVLALVVGAETAESVAKNFFGSEEYVIKNKDNEAYVRDLYNTFMNREADADGLSFWTETIAVGMSRDEVLTEFAKSEEFKAIAASYGLQ